MVLFALDKIIMAFMNVLKVHINILRNLRNSCKVLQGRQKYPALKSLKSESDQLAFSRCSPQPQPTTNAHGQSSAHLGGIGRGDRELDGALGSGKGIGKGKERGKPGE